MTPHPMTFHQFVDATIAFGLIIGLMVLGYIWIVSTVGTSYACKCGFRTKWYLEYIYHLMRN